MSSVNVLSIEQTAKILNLNETTIKRFAREKLIQCVEKEGQTLFVEEAVLKYKEFQDKFKR